MRTIAPEIFTDEFIGMQSMRLRLLWFGLILSIADDQGRMMDNPTLIRSLIFPYDATVTVKDVEKDLTVLDKAHKIVRYHAGTNGDGRNLMQITRWWRYQARAQWAKRSTFPAPDKWVDRIRCHVTGNAIETLNWELEGGFMLKLPKRLPSQLPTPKATKQATPKARREDEDEDKGRGRGREKQGVVNTKVSGKNAKPPVFSKEKPKGYEAIQKVAGR